MMETKFIPAPWKVIPADEFNSRIAISAKGAEKYSSRGPIALVGKRHKNAMANAYLIAAAPEMYEQLDFFLDYIKKHFPERGKIIEKILKKARGKA